MTSQPCVFIVEDDDALRDSLGMVIEMTGIAHRAFDSIDHFLENYDAIIPGCLILDLNLPKRNVTELLDEFSSRKILLPVILLIAYGDMLENIRVSHINVVAVLTKPVEVERLIDKILTLLNRQPK
ncbi:MAG: response regulator [Methylococcaceae bacterium]|nr:response regulator [Methylococcaceae bacterium]